MRYFRLLDFHIEPFSNSPDPRFFFQSRQHVEVLQKLEIAIRLKRGLNVVMGDVGTGKTTVSRQLIREIGRDEAIAHYLILDPGFHSVHAFLAYLLDLMVPGAAPQGLSQADIKERIKQHLFTSAVTRKTNTVLIIDEGQKLSLECMEALRELLNYETNDEKMLQIAIFAQKEFAISLEQMDNFKDRINFFYRLSPLNFGETRGLIRHRLQSAFSPGKERPIFTGPAFAAIYLITRGFPRRIISLCHQVILTMIIQKRKRAGMGLVRSCAGKMGLPVFSLARPLVLGLILAVFIGAGILYASGHFQARLITESETMTATVSFHTVPSRPPEPASTESAPPELEEEPVPQNPETGTSPGIPPLLLVIQSPETETPPPKAALPEKPVRQPQAGMYGSIRVPPKTTLSQLLNLMYGYYSHRIRDKILAANPRTVPAPDRLLFGEALRFPVLAQKERYPRKSVLLFMGQTRDLAAAFDLALSVADRKADLRIWPVKLPGNRFLFNLVLDRAFDSADAALAYLKKNHPDLQATARDVVSLHNELATGKG